MNYPKIAPVLFAGGMIALMSGQAAAHYNVPSPQPHSPDPSLQMHTFDGSPANFNTGGQSVTGPGQKITQEFKFSIPDNFTIRDIKVELSLSAYTGSWTDILLFKSGLGSPDADHRIRLFYFSCNYPTGGR